MKKIFAILLIVVIFSSMAFSLPIPVSAESLYIRKIVSVVYDDSGSMKGDKWAYANYAMQTFCGMLNSEDKLFITYMSHSQVNKNYKPKEVELSAGGIQNSVDSIRKHGDSGSTPYSAVDVAYNKLKSVQDSNPNTQYWLVVITDGAFDEHSKSNNNERKKILNKNFKAYAEETMPNGTKPQITFLGIGGVISPDEDKNKGIYTYSATNADGIIGAMSDMADRISGRTRLAKNEIKKINDNTLQVSSSIPLLNIAVFTQGSDAKVTKAVYSNEVSIPISRKVELSYPKYSQLVGGAFLLGDSSKIIGSGTYNITFDRTADLDDVIILFEPALEMRMTIMLNGKEISDYSELDNAMEGDKVSVSCKIYEMGTDTAVDPSLMPPGTKFEITVTEDGNVEKKVDGQELLLSDYVLKNKNTVIRAAAIIEGFNPIDYSAEFTPTKYVPKVVYTINAEFGNNVKSVRFDNVQNNKDLIICFTVNADGVPLTDPEAVKVLNPQINISPQGNDGAITYSDDGKIIFTPNAASVQAVGLDSYDVDVICTIDDGTSQKATYTVLLSEYAVVPVVTDIKIKKNEFYGNEKGVSFYITKDGARLNKADVEKGITVAFNESHSELKSKVSVEQDGTITIVPCSTEAHKLNFWSWWTNWAQYFGLSGEDLTVTLNHSFGSANSVIDVIEAGAKYQILNVYIPLIIEILLLAAIISYVVRYFTKPRFAPNGVLYVGSISLNRSTSGTHRIELVEVPLVQFNKFKNLWNPFKELTVSANGVNITAAKGNMILCNEAFPWYSDGIRPKTRSIRIETPKDVVNYCQEKDELVIHEIKTVRVMDEQNRMISQDDSVYYFARADITYAKVGTRQIEVIDSAVAFCYSTIQN